jgi:hypothetical protein
MMQRGDNTEKSLIHVAVSAVRERSAHEAFGKVSMQQHTGVVKKDTS